MKRFIKKDISLIPPNMKNEIHPISLNFIKNEENTCISKFHYDNEKFNNTSKYNCKNKDIKYNDAYKEVMYVPPIGISAADILQIYNIDSIDDLSNWISQNILEYNFFTLNRILNSWIRVYFDIIKKHNNHLEKICLSVMTKDFFVEKINNMKKKITDMPNEIKNFIDYWVNKNNQNEFKLNLLEDFLYFLNKKYNN